MSDTTTTGTNGLHLSGIARTAHHCHICDKWFVKGNVSCCVYHADGHCHYGDTEVTMGEAYRIVAPHRGEKP